MKKQKIVLIMIVFMFTFSSLLIAFPEPTPEPARSGTLTFMGKILPDLYFSVSELSTNKSFNLLTEEDLQPKGPGVDIGTWFLRVDNPPIATTSFDIKYTFNPLSISGVAESDTIEFELLVREDALETPAEVKSNNGITTVTLNTDPSKKLNTFTYIVAARLTPAGMESALLAAASLNYQSNITVTLLTE